MCRCFPEPWNGQFLIDSSIDMDLFFYQEQQRREWYKKCSQATKKILKSFQQSERPLFNFLIFAKDDKTQYSEEALSEYYALLQLEMLCQNDPKVTI